MEYAKEYTPQEFMAVILSREIKDGEIVGAGVNSQIPRAAIMLAQVNHAPNLIFHPTGMLACNVVGQKPVLYRSSTDFRMTFWAEQIRGHEIGFQRPAGYDGFFVGGIQVDKYGNINLIGIGSYPKLKLRGPGTVAVAWRMMFTKRIYIYLTRHDERTLVEKVNYVSAPGYDNMDYSTVPGGGPRLVVTPLAVMGFQKDTQIMELKSIHPNVSLETVKKKTGFPLKIKKPLAQTRPPTKKEIEVLRKIDEEELLRGGRR